MVFWKSARFLSRQETGGSIQHAEAVAVQKIKKDEEQKNE
jgi:hypothetical protein